MDAKKIIREMCLGAMAEGQRVKEAKRETDHLIGTRLQPAIGSAWHRASLEGKLAQLLMARGTCLTSHFARPC